MPLGLGKKRGQVSFEFLVLVGFILVFIAIIASVAFMIFSDSFTSQQTTDAVQILEKSVNHVYGLGAGNVVVISITLPGTVSDSFVGGLSGKELGFTATTLAGDQNYWIQTDSTVTGFLPTASGTFSIRVRADVNAVTLETVTG
ncbi:hypothetical protein KKE06_03855 [Candidatus Micrarchaeota archaeon]|nr:hypothetical protein [Candidatus Micrarchaeota archaeon]MBU1930646.1 hypothetical protein [Candidatus Micrarchaeota archaeon]